MNTWIVSSLALYDANTSVWDVTAGLGADGELGDALKEWLPYYLA
jgi:hypothetical protein